MKTNPDSLELRGYKRACLSVCDPHSFGPKAIRLGQLAAADFSRARKLREEKHPCPPK